ncbi:hypothetical protein V8C44DRAFT_335592 [Trichoderma aethiopicum]
MEPMGRSSCPFVTSYRPHGRHALTKLPRFRTMASWQGEQVGVQWMDASQQRRVTGHDALPSSAPAPLARQNSEEGGAPYTYVCVHNARSGGGNRKPDAHLPGSRPFAPSCLCCFCGRDGVSPWGVGTWTPRPWVRNVRSGKVRVPPILRLDLTRCDLVPLVQPLAHGTPVRSEKAACSSSRAPPQSVCMRLCDLDRIPRCFFPCVS